MSVPANSNPADHHFTQLDSAEVASYAKVRQLCGMLGWTAAGKMSGEELCTAEHR